MPREERLSDFRARVIARGLRELATGGEVVAGRPGRWFDAAVPRWACAAGHVSTRYLRTEVGAKCLACGRRVVIVWPEAAETWRCSVCGLDLPPAAGETCPDPRCGEPMTIQPLDPESDRDPEA